MSAQADLFASSPPPAWLSSELYSLPVLSIRQPWAWAIIFGGKDVENRSWFTEFRGRFLIHASKGCTRDEYRAALCFMSRFDRRLSFNVPPLEVLQRGGVIGAATLVECVHSSASPWFVGEWGFMLADVQPLEFYACPGALGFFRLPVAA